MDVGRQIRNALEARFEKFGTADLKNIKLPMDLFRIVLPWESGGKPRSEIRVPKKSQLALLAVAAVVVLVGLLFGWLFMQRSAGHRQNASTGSPSGEPAVPAKAPDQNAVAALPFVNLTDDNGTDYFSDGAIEEL